MNLISRKVNRSGLRRSHSKVFSSGKVFDKMKHIIFGGNISYSVIVKNIKVKDITNKKITNKNNMII